MKKTAVIFLLLIWSMVLPAIILSSPENRTRTVMASVSAFNKGDNLIVLVGGRKTAVTLWGIDAPEVDQPGGREAVANLYRIVGHNRVRIEVVSRDRYGRITGKVYVGGTYLNRQMIADGFAWWDRHEAGAARDFQGAEVQARLAHRGIWQNDRNVSPFEWRKKVFNRNAELGQPETEPVAAP